MRLTKEQGKQIDAGLERAFATLRKIMKNPKDIDSIIREEAGHGVRRVYVSKVTSGGRITIPKALRDELGFGAGFVFIDTVGDAIRIRKIRSLDEAISGYLGEPGQKRGRTRKGLRKALERAGPKIMNEIYGVRPDIEGLVDRGESVPKEVMRKEIIRCPCGHWMRPRMFRIHGFDIRGSECPKCKEGSLNGADANRSLIFNKIANQIMERLDIEDWMEVNARTKRELARSRAAVKAGKVHSLEDVKKGLGHARRGM